ncbi:MAG TPA: alkaline phosphatase family protein, partial [Ktedonobacterales bacterium]
MLHGVAPWRRAWPWALGVWAAVALLVVEACAASSTQLPTTIHAKYKIQHVIVIMQENRSFDSYFGTYPGADGIPMQNGVPTVCVPDPAAGQCVKPYHDPNDLNRGGPHGQSN